MQSIRKILVFVVGLLLLSGSAWSQDTVAYHIGDTQTQALAGLRSVRNHLDTDPTAKIVVVAIGNGVDFLLEGAKEATGGDYVGLVSALVSRGVRFEVCEITLRARNLKRDQFLQEAEFTPSGVVRLAKLQHQGYAYIRP